MGGSGGGYFPANVAPNDLAKRTRQAESRVRDDAFETAVGGLLASLLAGFNERDADGIQEVFDLIKADMGEEIDGTIDTLFGGSISKHTYVDGISDVDALVLLNQSELAAKSPKEVKLFLAELLRGRYGQDRVRVGALAVTVSLKDVEIQLLPALRHRTGLKIANASGSDWSKVDPGRFAEALTKANRRLGGKLIPCIKLIKAIIATLPEKRRVTGYHAEAMALSVFGSYTGTQSTKAMLSYFFQRAPDRVKKAIRDRSGQSAYVDEYLGSDNSLQRRIVADALGRVGRRIRNADGARSRELWERLFG